MAYLSPGVYVEEVESAVKPIAGVGTSTAAFIGEVSDTTEMPMKPGYSEEDSPIEYYELAPVDEVKRITSWEEFKKNFGDFQPGNKILAHAVYGFFNNGGTACYVARVIQESPANDYSKILKEFESIDEIAIVAIPGETIETQQLSVLEHCENMKDRFAIIDGQQDPASYTVSPVAGTLRNAIDGYGAMYFPWIQVYDPDTSSTIEVPPSGHIAGIYARSDGTRGVHKTPANEVVKGAVSLKHKLSKADQEILNPAGINVIRSFNRNITVWGGRTFADTGVDAEWKYISTRRLMNYIRESIEEGTRWVVFEPNDMGLWKKITRNITAFLTNVWRDGALFGASPEEAFFVKCDAETNPPEVREMGQVVTEIGVAIVKPAEFVIFRISQKGGTPS